MANILDYITWRGDLSFVQAPFNEVDNLILARISYLPFDKLIKENEVITLQETYKRFNEYNVEELDILQKEDLDLFPLVAKSNRFGKLLLSNYVNKIDLEEEKQFSVITIRLLYNTIYISYRGTDNTFVGWKEDFNMSFKELVPAQIDAVQYLEEVGKKWKGNIIVGGHSKGGNLAIYASTFCNKKIQKKIVRIYNNDGPGFNKKIIESNEYKNIVEKIYTYIPQSSVIGRLLNNEGSNIIVKSTQVGLLQHDVYSWKVLGNKFVHSEELTDGSEISTRMIKEWLEKVGPDKREQFIDILFQILNTTNAETFPKLTSKWFSNARIILKSYKDMDETSKKVISETLHVLFDIAKSNLLNKKDEKEFKTIGG